MGSKLQFLAILLAFALSGCNFSKPEDITCPPVRIYNTHGSATTAKWTQIEGLSDTLDPNQIIVENGLIRLTYPCNLGRNGKDPQKFDQKAGKLVYLKINGEYKLAQNEDYGDWIYVDDSMIDTLTGFKITKNTDSIMGLEAIRRGVGKDSYISVCGGHYGGSFGIAQSQRSGSDVLSIWQESELYKYRQNILRTWMSDLWHVDPDAMMVRRKTDLPFDEYDLAAGFFTDDEAFTNTINQFVGGNLLTFSEKFSTLDEDRKMLYKHVILSPNTSSRALDLFNPMIPEQMLTQIHPIAKNLGDWKMLTLINWYDKEKKYLIPIDETIVGSIQAKSFIVFDFQSQNIISRLIKGDTLLIEAIRPHHSKLLKILPWDGKSAVFVGTDLNFSC